MEHSGATYKSQIPEALWKVMKYRGGHTPVWSKEVLDTLVGEVKSGKDISCEDYPDSAPDVELALRIQGVKGKRIMVGGSISPWVESVALALGASSFSSPGRGQFDGDGLQRVLCELVATREAILHGERKLAQHRRSHVREPPGLEGARLASAHDPRG